MNLDELQSVRDRERQTDKLQQLRESFYADAGEFIQSLREERDVAAERADDPFEAPEVKQLSDKIGTAESTVEAIYEKRIGKLVKAASFDAAGLPSEAEGMTTEEQDLFETLVGDIQANRQRVLAVLEGKEVINTDSGVSQEASDHDAADTGESAGERSQVAAGEQADEEDRDGVSPAQLMGGDSDGSSEASRDGTDDPDSNPAAPSSPSPPPDVPPDEPPEQPMPEPPAPEELESKTEGAASSEGTEGNDEGGVDRNSTTVREDGGAGVAETGGVDPEPEAQGGNELADETTDSTGSGISDEDIERRRVMITEDIETFVGFDDRDYDLRKDDVVVLPKTNADLLIEQDVARLLE